MGQVSVAGDPTPSERLPKTAGALLTSSLATSPVRSTHNNARPSVYSWPRDPEDREKHVVVVI